MHTRAGQEVTPGMSRRRSPAPIESPQPTPEIEEAPEPIVEAGVEETDASEAVPQSQAVTYGLTLALIVMLLVCALAIYIAAP